MLHERKVLVTIMSAKEIDPDTAEVEVLERLMEFVHEKTHAIKADSVHVIALEKVK